MFHTSFFYSIAFCYFCCCSDVKIITFNNGHFDQSVSNFKFIVCLTIIDNLRSYKKLILALSIFWTSNHKLPFKICGWDGTLKSNFGVICIPKYYVSRPNISKFNDFLFLFSCLSKLCKIHILLTKIPNLLVINSYTWFIYYIDILNIYWNMLCIVWMDALNVQIVTRNCNYLYFVNHNQRDNKKMVTLIKKIPTNHIVST